MSVTEHYQPVGRTSSEIARDVERAVRQAEMAPGERLPAIRDVAAHLGVSPTTVAAAYRSLREWGLIDTHPRGSRVAQRPPLLLRPATPLPEGVTDLADGNPDPDLLPDLSAPLATVLQDKAAVLYGEAPDLPDLAAIARHEFAADGIPTDHVTFVGGALDGIERALLARLHRGDRIAVEDPAYDGVLDLLRALNLRPVPVGTDAHGPDPDSLADALDGGVAACIVTPRAQNPTGAALTGDRAQQLCEVLASRPEVLVIEDDHAAAIAGTDHHPLCTADREGWVVVRSVGKALSPDLRIAAIAGDALTISRLAGRRAVGTGWVSTILQRLLLALWSDSDVHRQLDTAARTYTRRRRQLIDELRRHGLEANARSGWNVWIPVDDETAVVQHLRDAGWATRAGHRFRLTSPPAIRVTTARLDGDGAERFATDLAISLAAGHPTRSA